LILDAARAHLSGHACLTDQHVTVVAADRDQADRCGILSVYASHSAAVGRVFDVD
jgi:hypothetical protein